MTWDVRVHSACAALRFGGFLHGCQCARRRNGAPPGYRYGDRPTSPRQESSKQKVKGVSKRFVCFRTSASNATIGFPVRNSDR